LLGRYELCANIHEAFLGLACWLVCFRRLTDSTTGMHLLRQLSNPSPQVEGLIEAVRDPVV